MSFIVNGDTLNQNAFASLSDSVIYANTDIIIASHDATRAQTDLETNRLIPGTEAFNEKLAEITSKIPIDGGTGFYDKSALNHIHGEYFLVNNDIDKIKIGGNFRQYLFSFYDQNFITFTYSFPSCPFRRK
jgi:hypothetical protein